MPVLSGMTCNPMKAALAAAVLLVALPWHALHEDISCVVTTRADDAPDVAVAVSGYYTATGGVYVRRSERDMAVLPDFFGLAARAIASKAPLSSAVIISQDRHRWLIQQQQPQRGAGGGVGRRDLYYSSPEHAQQYLFHPPPSAWHRILPTPSVGTSSSSVPGDLTVGQCRGSLVRLE